MGHGYEPYSDRPRVASVVIAGTGKSGTSSMFAYLGAHPEICPSRPKETHFFDPVLRGEPLPHLRDYADHWRHATGERHLLEATPLYCVGGARMAEALHAHLGRNLRVMLLVRDPIERLEENFRYMRQKLQLPGIEDFGAYVDRCLAIGSTDQAALLAAGASGWARAFYGDYLPPWLERFGDRLRIVWFEDLAERTEQAVAETFSWLGLDPAPARSIDYRIHNETLEPRSRAVQRLAVLANRVAGRALRTTPQLKAGLRRAYDRVNGVEAAPPPADHDARRRVADALQDSNRRFAAALRAAGHTTLPPWLAQAVPATATTTSAS